MQLTADELRQIKIDVVKSKSGIEHIKEKIAVNTKEALRLLGRKRTLETTKRVIVEDLMKFKDSLSEIKRLVQEGEFV